ncbi:DICT sensory domain-containing protein [Natronomonas amylolytica]|uniref:DICT sensory domain-containing protein n=1 Tax=Natronomonas amylolytica TaxID=3108498 RepID=UPI0030081FAC
MLDALIAEAEASNRQLVVYRRDEGTDLGEWFANHGVEVEYRPLPATGPDPFVVIKEGGEFVGALGVAELTWLTEPPIARPGDREGLSEGYRVLFELLDETVYTAMERRQLLAVSREIEDRVYRTGAGTFHVSFQTLSTFESQLEPYRRLAAETDVDVHIHGLADWSPPAIPGITYHEYSESPLKRYWALAFDGGDGRTQPCGLVAREESDGYSGFWTDDAETVDAILTELAEG